MLYEFDHQQSPTFINAEVTDEQLIGRVQSGDEAALALLHHRHSPLLRTVISRVVHNDADTDDVLQEVFLELWNRSHSYSQDKGKALGWMVTIARRRAIDRIRRRQAYCRAEERMRLESGGRSEIDETQSVADEVGAADRAEVFQKLLSTLPEAQREALHMAYYKGLSQREIAAKTGIPLGTIKTRLELAVRKMRAAITALGGAEEWGLVTN
jgi:RNA polymerase sigma-70 factor (ECF subfamily)